MIAHALDLGVNFFDTANCYSHGTSEEYLGAALKSLGVTMSEVALAWHFARGVTAPIVGATNAAHFDDTVRSVDLTLSADDIKFLEEAYRAHEVKGALPAVRT